MAHMGKNQEGKIYGQKSCDTLPLNIFFCQFSVQFNWKIQSDFEGGKCLAKNIKYG